jgi:hypothetical protein
MYPKLQGARTCARLVHAAGPAVVVAGLLVACSRADSQRVPAAAHAPAVPQATGDPVLATSVVYRPDPPTAAGRVTGSIAFDGPTPSDSIIHPQTDVDVCGQTLVDPSVDHRGPLLANAVVWLDGVTAGKPMPLARRYEITNEGCRLVPRVQVAIAGGTLDVRNSDQALTRTRFIQSSTRTILAAVMETEAGTVVPSRKVLETPGLVEVDCDTHPWARAWILVFNQPYFAMTNANGAFGIDSVPPGRYRVTVWHERFGMQSDSVTVVAGQDAVVDVTFKNTGSEVRGPGSG